MCALGPQCIVLPHFQHGGRFFTVVLQAVFCCISVFIVFLAFAHLFYTKMLYFESLRVAKLDFGIDVLTFKACQGNLSHFSNKVKFSHFCLCLVGQNFCQLMALRCWCLALKYNESKD